MAKNKKYPILHDEICTDIVSEFQYDFLYNNGEKERLEDGTLRVLSLFSGCGGMDIGLEGGFICSKKSVTNPSWIEKNIDDDWVLLKRNRFRTVFACDILPEARLAWLKYMSRYDVNPEIYHLTSIVDLVKQNKETKNVFPFATSKNLASWPRGHLRKLSPRSSPMCYCTS